MKLQKIRYDNSFVHEINIKKNVNLKTLVPKHVLFCYVENAIKHGLSKKSNKGLLKISGEYQNNNLVLSVVDNGSGFDKLKTLKKDSTGNGLKIMEQIYSLFSKLYKKKIEHQIIELKGNSKKMGVRVKIIISKKYSN